MKNIFSILFLLCFASSVFAQVAPETLAKREKRKNMVVKEWNTIQGTKVRFMDRLTTYDEFGRKIEEIEYTSYGQKYRITYEYDETGAVGKEVEYDDRNKPVRIRKYEYYPDGTKRKQYNYMPNGKLYSVKVFEYISVDAFSEQ